MDLHEQVRLDLVAFTHWKEAAVEPMTLEEVQMGPTPTQIQVELLMILTTLRAALIRLREE